MSIVLLALIGCNENGLTRLDQVDEFTQEGTEQVDILFVVDDSRSMASEQEKVAEGFGDFMAAFVDTGLDFQIGVTTTDLDQSYEGAGRLVGNPPYLGADDDWQGEMGARFQVGVEGSDKERGLEAAWRVLSGEDSYNDGFLRQAATLAIIFVSDENDCSHEGALSEEALGSRCYEHDEALVPVTDYIARFRSLKAGNARVIASGILGPDIQAGCEGTWPGHRYATVSEHLDGSVGDICDTDYGEIMDIIGSKIIAPATIFPLSELPVEDSITVEIDGEYMVLDPDVGWNYDREDNSVRFDGVYVPPYGTTLEIRYEIAHG
jgi:hypothetical protein